MRKESDSRSAFRSLAAIGYLADQGGAAFRVDFERAAAGGATGVRIEAARAIARFDKRHAMTLLGREFDSRVISACVGANDALNTLTGRQRRVDCTDPVARRDAKEAWSRN